MQGQSVNQRNEETMTSDRFGLEGICDEKSLATDLHSGIDMIEVSGELKVTSHVYIVNTFEHFVFPFKYYFLI